MRGTDREVVADRGDQGAVVISHPPKKNLWILLGLFYPVICVIGAFAPGRYGQPPPIGGQIFFFSVAAISLWGILYLILWTCRARVVVDREGIRWRGMWHGWRFAPWDAVVDYRIAASTQPVRTTRQINDCTIETKRGTLHFFDDWANAESLRRAIQQRASSARVSDWERLGTRAIDPWPHVFRYWDPAWRLRSVLVALGGLVMMTIAMMTASHFLKSVEPLFDADEMKRATVAIYVSIAVLLSIPAMPLTRYLKGWRRRGETFTVTRDMLRYTNAATGEEIQASWSDVSDYFYKSDSSTYGTYTLILRGSEEKQISWKPALIDSSLLLAIIQRYAPCPAKATDETEGWRQWSENEKTGGSDPATWQGGVVGIGGRVFSYRSASIAVILSIFAVCTVSLGTLFTLSVPRGGHDVWMGWIMVSLIGLPTLLGWCRFLFSRVEMDDMGITQYTLLRKKRLYWYLIEDYKENMLPGYPGQNAVRNLLIQGRNGTRLTIAPDITGYRELKREIKRCAPPPKTGWKQTEESMVRITEGTTAPAPDSRRAPTGSTTERDTVTVGSGRNDH